MLRGRTCRIIAPLIVSIGIFMFGSALAQESGEAIFNRICKACHTVGQGKLVGPDLAGVSQRRSVEWIIPFVQSSQTVIKSGDPDAAAMFEQFNKLIMPDNPLSRSEVMTVIRYIEAAAGDPAAVSEVLPTPLETATEADLARGAALFQGTERLQGGGPSCSSCHHANAKDIQGGGALAVDLTAVVSRMPAPGVQAILANPPFPVMEQAYADRPLTEDEVFALTAFLEKLNADQVVEAESHHGQLVLAGGFAGSILLLALFAMIWMRRKQAMVYRDIHRRQLSSR
ncbi:MAG: c-type cytochrome [bacterium]|nr:c-type cytochrome [bacterium]